MYIYKKEKTLYYSPSVAGREEPSRNFVYTK